MSGLDRQSDDWRPTAGPGVLRERGRLLAALRDYFARQGVLEVETPILCRAAGLDPNIAQFSTEGRWLRTSPEYAMKRLLAAGSGDIYELGRVFRSGESGSHHNPEFTLLEWYRVGWTLETLQEEVGTLINLAGSLHGKAWPQVRISYRELFLNHLDLDPLQASEEELSHCASSHGIELGGSTQLGRNEWLDLLLSHLVQPALPAGQITHVQDYPASQAALARLKPGEPDVAERFETYLGSVELANGYRELSDPVEQRARFTLEARTRAARGAPASPPDERLLAALAHGLPDCSGVALGFDRLLMQCLGLERLELVVAFPDPRA